MRFQSLPDIVSLLDGLRLSVADCGRSFPRPTLFDTPACRCCDILSASTDCAALGVRWTVADCGLRLSAALPPDDDKIDDFLRSEEGLLRLIDADLGREVTWAFPPAVDTRIVEPRVDSRCESVHGRSMLPSAPTTLV